MPPEIRLLSVRYLLHRWDRSALIVMSIALGVATLVSTRMLNRCIETATSETTTPLGMGDLYITNGELGVVRNVADEIRDAKITGVKSVQPLVVDSVVLPQQGNRKAVLIGAELAKHQLGHSGNPLAALDGDNELNVKFTHLPLTLGVLTRRPIAISRFVYDEWIRVRADDSAPFVIRYGDRSLDCEPIGVIDYSDDSPLSALGKNLVGMEIVQAARFLHPPSPAEVEQSPRVNRIDVLLEKGTDRASVQAAIGKIVGDRAEVRTPEVQGRNTKDIVDGIQVGFTMCSIGAMVVGLFLVYNALAVTVAERRHDIGILRSIGATRGQIIRLFAMSALMLGMIGAIVGVPLGIALARLAINQIREDLTVFLNPDINISWPTLGTALLAMAAGIATAIFAALVPAVQAAAQDPADAVRRVPGGVGGAWRVAHKVVCASLVAGGVGMILSRHELPTRLGAFAGMATTLVGLLLAMPIFVGIVVQALQPLLRQVLPIEARLAADNLIRSPGRTGLVIGALAAGVAIMVQTAGVGRSNEEPITRWLGEVIQADMFVSAGSIQEVMSSQCPVDPSLIRDLSGIQGVEHVCGIRYVRPQYNGTTIFLVALDVSAFVDPSQKRGTNGLPALDKMRKLPAGNNVLVSDNFAQLHGVRAGGTISLPGRNGPVSLTVINTVQDYTWSRGTIFMDRGVYSRLFEDSQVDICHVFVSNASEAENLAARSRVTQFTSDRGLIAADSKMLQKYLSDLFGRVYKLVHLQQIVVGVVAALGVVTSLLISVLQRKRELGLLLAVGATPAQVVRTVLAEAVLMGLFGTALGILMGVPLEWYVLKVVLFEESGFLFDLILPWKQTLVIAAGSLLTATLAGLLPALHAIKTRIPDAIAYE